MINLRQAEKLCEHCTELSKTGVSPTGILSNFVFAACTVSVPVTLPASYF